MIKCIQESTRKTKTKTVCIEKLEIPSSKGDNDMFQFGKNKQNIDEGHPSCEILTKIPEISKKRSKSHLNKDSKGNENYEYNEKCKKVKKKGNEHKKCKSQVY